MGAAGCLNYGSRLCSDERSEEEQPQQPEPPERSCHPRAAAGLRHSAIRPLAWFFTRF